MWMITKASMACRAIGAAYYGRVIKPGTDLVLRVVELVELQLERINEDMKLNDFLRETGLSKDECMYVMQHYKISLNDMAELKVLLNSTTMCIYECLCLMNWFEMSVQELIQFHNLYGRPNEKQMLILRHFGAKHVLNLSTNQ